MAFVKLDCGILDSTLWVDRDSREIFITALLMAEPHETTKPIEQLDVRSAATTGWMVPPGWYGFVAAAGPGIVRRAGIDHENGMNALLRLGSPEPESRSPDHEGRRLVRVAGGYIILNYMKYRERDYTSAERSKRYRDRRASRRDATVTHRDITQAEAEAEGYPLRSSSVGTLVPSSSDKPNGPDRLHEAAKNRTAVVDLVATLPNRMPT